MVELDASIGRSVEEWLADELPQIISREFDAMTERIRIHTLAHMRATLVAGDLRLHCTGARRTSAGYPRLISSRRSIRGRTRPPAPL